MCGAFPLFILYTLRKTLLLPFVLFFLFLYLNIISAARIAQYNDCYVSDGPGFEFRYRQEISTKVSTGLRGVFPGGLTQNSHPSSADLKNVWRHTSTSLLSFVVCIWTEGGDTREQDTGQLN